MKPKTFLELHEGLLSGEIKLEYGLCDLKFKRGQLGNNRIFALFDPSGSQARELGHYSGYWGDTLDTEELLGTQYNDFRQTVILLCAAINGEL